MAIEKFFNSIKSFFQESDREIQYKNDYLTEKYKLKGYYKKFEKQGKMNVQEILKRDPKSKTFETIEIDKIEDFVNAVTRGQHEIHRTNLLDQGRILVFNEQNLIWISKITEFFPLYYEKSPKFDDAALVGVLNNNCLVYVSKFEFPPNKALLICEGRGIEMILRSEIIDGKEATEINVRMATEPLYFKGEASWWGFIDFSKALEVKNE